MSQAKGSPQRLSDRIYRYLRENIIKNEIEPGNIIRENDITCVFNSSTTPVREAIKRLASEGFVEVQPYRHAKVSEIPHKEYKEIRETMYVLDSYACKVIIKKLTEKDHQELRDMTFEMEKYCSSVSIETYLEINAGIHIYLWEFLKNEFLYATLRQVFDKFLRSHRHVLFTKWIRENSALKKSMRLHKKMTDILIARDTSRIGSIVKKHWGL